MKEPKKVLHTCYIENTIRDYDGNPISQRFIFYSAACDPPMAASLFESLKRRGISCRIAVEKTGEVIDEWLRPGWKPEN